MSDNLYYPKLPQMLYEMIVGLMVSVNDFVDENLTVNPRLLLVPCDYYIYSWAVMASWYSALIKNHKIKKIIIVSNSSKEKFSWYAIPSFSNYKNILSDIKISNETYELFESYKDFHSIDWIDSFDNIDCQIPFIISTIKPETILPILVWKTNRYIKLVNFIVESLKDEGTAVVISWNLSNNFDQKDMLKKDSKQAQAIVQNDIKTLNSSVDESNILLRIFSSVCKKKWYDIPPLIYSNSSEFDDTWKLSRWYFSMVAGD